MLLNENNWRKVLENINIPKYLEEYLDEYFNYRKEKNEIMYLAAIDEVISGINVAEQEKDLTVEEAKYIRKILF